MHESRSPKLSSSASPQSGRLASRTERPSLSHPPQPSTRIQQTHAHTHTHTGRDRVFGKKEDKKDKDNVNMSRMDTAAAKRLMHDLKRLNKDSPLGIMAVSPVGGRNVRTSEELGRVWTRKQRLKKDVG